MLPLILASASPRRRDLLTEMGLAFEARTSPVTELDARSSPNVRPAELATANARLKATAVASPGRWTLGADTVVAFEDMIFGKPTSLLEAREILRTLGGKTHSVITACVLIGPDGGSEDFHETSRVTFRSLSEELITRYFGAVDVLDKAGAYALQEHGDWLVEEVEGSRANVIGLPVEKLKVLLRLHGIV